MALDPRQFEEDDAPGGAPEWMATFSDLCTLLLTFFVLLLSFANLDAKEFREMLGSAREAFGVQRAYKGHMLGLTTTPVELGEAESMPWAVLSSKESEALDTINKFVLERDLERDVEISLSERGVVVRLSDRLTFEPGSDALSEEVRPMLDALREMLESFPAGLSVEGHTDARPIHTARFPSNWELSAARASSVVRYMSRKGPLPVQELRIIGYADRKPLVPNDSDEHRARNRRVEFVFERQPKPMKFGKREPDASAPRLRVLPQVVGLENQEAAREAEKVGRVPPGIEYKVLPALADVEKRERERAKAAAEAAAQKAAEEETREAQVEEQDAAQRQKSERFERWRRQLAPLRRSR